MNKIINTRCVCGSALPYKKYKQIMLEPCEHILHRKCLNSTTTCPICKTAISKITTLTELRDKKLTKHEYQKYIDLISMSNFDNVYSPGRKRLINIIDAVGIASKFPFLNCPNDGKEGCFNLFCLMNSKIILKGLKNIDKTKPHVYISNHTSYLDFIILFYILGCGFLASSIIRDITFGKQILKVIPLLIIQRGKDFNTVDKMRAYVKERGSICLFPEGIITHPDTIIRFRTGAFHIGYPIYPIVIRYEPVIYDTDIKKFVEKIISQPDVKIRIDILPAQYPPFDENKIEQIRMKMGKVGNMALSRVSNRDIKD